MQITPHIHSVHIQENPDTFGAMHPGGTQIYFAGDPAQEMALIDSGEPYRSWTQQILAGHAQLGRPKIAAILITHGHNDHTGGLDRLQEAFDCPVHCHPQLEPRLTHRLGPGIVTPLTHQQTIPIANITIRAYHTPGHEDDHIAYHLPQDNALFSGDTILGDSSTSVRNLTQYMESLQTIAQINPAILCPGHGQTIPNAPARIAWYIRHRQERETQILTALAKGPADLDQLTDAVYPRDLPPNLRQAAARNIQTHLQKLTQEQRATKTPATYTLTPQPQPPHPSPPVHSS